MLLRNTTSYVPKTVLILQDPISWVTFSTLNTSESDTSYNIGIAQCLILYRAKSCITCFTKAQVIISGTIVNWRLALNQIIRNPKRGITILTVFLKVYSIFWTVGNFFETMIITDLIYKLRNKPIFAFWALVWIIVRSWSK